VADLAQGKVWAADDVEAWMRVHRRDIDEADD
jgi:prophage regulatory protein